MLVLRVIASQQQGEAQAARTALAHALTLAAPMGYVSIFLAEGAPMAALLQQARASSSELSYIDKLLTAFAKGLEARDLRLVDTVPASSLKPLASLLVEPLTTRELEVLRQLADGASNSEIAERLIISLGTVKKHLANIFGKLAAQSRTQAIARARALKLL